MIVSTTTEPVKLSGIKPSINTPLQQDSGVRGGQFSYSPLDQRRLYKHLEYTTELPILKSNDRIMIDLTPFYPYPSYWLSTLPEYQTYPNRQIGFDGNGQPIGNSIMPAYKEYISGIEPFNNMNYLYNIMYLIIIILIGFIIIRINKRK